MFQRAWAGETSGEWGDLRDVRDVRAEHVYSPSDGYQLRPHLTVVNGAAFCRGHLHVYGGFIRFALFFISLLNSVEKVYSLRFHSPINNLLS
jgi:hypothetical protein